MTDPTAPLAERTPEQISDFLDQHILMALEAADHLKTDRQEAEDYIRDRLVALSDSYPTRKEVTEQRRAQTLERIRQVLVGED